MKIFSGFQNKIKDIFGMEDFYFNPEDTGVRAQLWNPPSFKDLIPYLAYDDENALFINNKSIGFVFETLPLVGGDERIYKEFEALFQNILPAKSSIQFLLYASPHIGSFLNKWEKARENASNIFSEIAFKRVEHFKRLALEGDSKSLFRTRIFRLIISYTHPQQELKKMDLYK